MDRLKLLNLSLNNGNFRINQCCCDWQKYKKKKSGEKLKPTSDKVNHEISGYMMELKMRQKKIDEQNKLLLNMLLRTVAKVSDRTSLKISDRHLEKKLRRVNNYLMPEKLIPMNNCRRKIFLEFSPDAEAVQSYGRLSVILLFDLVPETCRVFVDYITRCTFGKGLPVNKIYSGSCMEFTIDNIDSSLKTHLNSEIVPMKHNYAGTLSSMCAERKFLRGSYLNFIITFNPLPHLDGKRQVFGYVVKGGDELKYMESLGTKRGWKKEDVFLTRCGLEKRTTT